MTHKLDPNWSCFFMWCYFPFISTEVQLIHFHESEVSNYSTLLLSEDKDVLYVGAREMIFALNAINIAEKQHEVSMHFNTLFSTYKSYPKFDFTFWYQQHCVLGVMYWKEKMLSGLPLFYFWKMLLSCYWHQMRGRTEKMKYKQVIRGLHRYFFFADSVLD